MYAIRYWFDSKMRFRLGIEYNDNSRFTVALTLYE